MGGEGGAAASQRGEVVRRRGGSAVERGGAVARRQCGEVLRRQDDETARRHGGIGPRKLDQEHLALMEMSTRCLRDVYVCTFLCLEHVPSLLLESLESLEVLEFLDLLDVFLLRFLPCDALLHFQSAIAITMIAAAGSAVTNTAVEVEIEVTSMSMIPSSSAR